MADALWICWTIETNSHRGRCIVLWCMQVTSMRTRATLQYPHATTFNAALPIAICHHYASEQTSQWRLTVFSSCVDSNHNIAPCGLTSSGSTFSSSSSSTRSAMTSRQGNRHVVDRYPSRALPELKIPSIAFNTHAEKYDDPSSLIAYNRNEDNLVEDPTW